MKRLLLGFGLVVAVAYALRARFAAPQPYPSWEETDNDPEDLGQDLRHRHVLKDPAADFFGEQPELRYHLHLVTDEGVPGRGDAWSCFVR